MKSVWLSLRSSPGTAPERNRVSGREDSGPQENISTLLGSSSKCSRILRFLDRGDGLETVRNELGKERIDPDAKILLTHLSL
jgi:hypothetical protein